MEALHDGEKEREVGREHVFENEPAHEPKIEIEPAASISILSPSKKDINPPGPLERLTRLESGSLQIIASIEIFERYFRSGLGMARLFEHVSCDDNAVETLAAKFASPGEFDALWLLLLLECEGTPEELKCVQQMNDAFLLAKKIPTGLRLKHDSWGYFPITNSALEVCKEACKEAVHVLLVMMDTYCSRQLGPVHLQSARILFIKAALRSSSTEPSLVLLSTRAVAFLMGISVDDDYKVTVDLNEIPPPMAGGNEDEGGQDPAMWSRYALAESLLDLIFGAFDISLRRFHDLRISLRLGHKELTEKLELERDAIYEYGVLLNEVTGEDDEDKLPVSLQHYLKDNEPLRLAYIKMNKVKEVVVNTRHSYQNEQLRCMMLVPCVRFSVAVLVHILSVVLTPSLQRTRAGHTHFDTQSTEVEVKVLALLRSVPWTGLMREFYEVERHIYGAVYTRILATVACILSPQLQETMATDEFETELDLDRPYENDKPHLRSKITAPSIVRKALNDLVNPGIEWSINIQESFPAAESWQQNQVLHRPTRHTRLDTRISTALVYWSGHHNASVQDSIRSWRANILSPLYSADGSVTDSSPLMWRQLIIRSDKDQEGEPFAFEDGSIRHIDREYKEYHEELADAAIYEFLLAENQKALEQEASFNEQARNKMKLCSDRRVLSYYGNALAMNFFDVIMRTSCFNFEGSCSPDLTGVHPMAIVTQLSAHTCNGVDTVAKMIFSDHEMFVCTLLKIITHSGELNNKYEDATLQTLAMSVLSNAIQGPLHIQTNPSVAAVYKEHVMVSAFPMAIHIMTDVYSTEVQILVDLCCNILYRGDLSDMCPMGVLSSVRIITAARLLTNLAFIASPASILESLKSACMNNFGKNCWHVATVTIYERHNIHEDEREEHEADQEDPAQVARFAARKEKNRQSYVNFFLFAIEGGLVSLALHLIKEAKWLLSEDTRQLFMNGVEGSVSEEYRSVILTLINVICAPPNNDKATSGGEMLDLLMKETNFIAAAMRKCLTRASEDLPQLAQLKCSPQNFEHNGAIMRLNVAMQAMRLATRMISSGRVNGKVPHMSITNEFMVYFALADTADSLQAATDIFAFASINMQKLSFACMKQGGERDGELGRGKDDPSTRGGITLPPLFSQQLHEHQHRRKVGNRSIVEHDPLSVNNLWEEYIQFFFFTTLRDTALFTVEFLHNLCSGRLELQTKVEQECTSLFEHMPRLISLSSFLGKKASSITASRLLPANRYFHFHIGLSRNICNLVTTLCYRHEGNCALVLLKGGMVSLCAAMNDCADDIKLIGSRVQRVWSECITHTIEALVSRNVDAWTYCQDVSGVDGLFTLISLGNNVIKKLCISTMLDHSAEETGSDYIDEMVAKNGISTLKVLILIPDDELVLATLRLIKVIVISSREFRVQAFSPSQKEFFCNITKMLQRQHVEIQGVVCGIFDYFCSEDAEALRTELLKYGAIEHLVHIAGEGLRGSNVSEPGNNANDLASTAAKTIANLTVSDESEFLVGSAPLRPTLESSGILPSLKPHM